jgi:hypothetical protein
MSKHKNSIASDLLHGANEVSKFLGIPERQVYYYVEKGQLPVTKMGSLIVASKTVLRRHFIPEKAAS